MKKNICLFLLLLSNLIYGQSLSVFNLDKSAFPTIKAKFFVFDKNGNQISNFSPSDFLVTENGQSRKVINVTCPTPKPPLPVSIAMSIDVSGSMRSGDAGEVPVDFGKETAKSLVGQIMIPPSEIALQTCNDVPMIWLDFTQDKDKFLSSLVPIQASGNNDFVEQLLNQYAGILNIAKTGKLKRIAVLYTDAWWSKLSDYDLQRCIDTCGKYDISFYAIIYSRIDAEPDGIKASLKSLCDATGGKIYDGITSVAAATELARDLQNLIQGGDPCTIEWQSGFLCESKWNNVMVSIPSSGDSSGIGYQSPLNAVAELKVFPNYILLKNMPPGIKKDTTITVKAINADFNINDITSTNSEFTISPKNFTLKAGDSKTLALSFIPTDSDYVFSKFSFETDKCPAVFYASGGFLGKRLKLQTLKLIRPNGGEYFLAGSDTIISWEGISPGDTVTLELSIDNGMSWKLLTNNASNLKYFWKNIPKPPSNKCLVRVKQLAKDTTNNAGSLTHLLKHNTAGVMKVSWSPDGNWVATACDDGKIGVWNLVNPSLSKLFPGHKATIRDINWSPDGLKIVTACDDNTAKIWDAVNGNLIFTLTGHYRSVNHANWSPDGTKIATSSNDGTAKIWDPNTGSVLHTLTGHTADVNDVSWSPDGSMIATASNDNTAKIWDKSNGSLISTLHGHTGYVNNVCWNYNASMIATSSDDYTAGIWDVGTGGLIKSLVGHSDAVNWVCWRPDGLMVATVSYDNIAKIWDVGTGSMIHNLTGHTRYVWRVGWSPDGNQLATASYDNTARIWNANTGILNYILKGHTSNLNDVAWSPDGLSVATSCWDSTARIWDVGAIREVQSDVSDSVFSIVIPQFSGIDVDMKQVLVGSDRDSVIKSFISNSGTCTFKVDSIYFSGADAGQFKLVGGTPPFYIEPGTDKAVEIRFSPTSVGLKSSEIIIKIGEDTLINNIRGEGIQNQLSLNTSFINFGKIRVGNYKDTTIKSIISNNGSVPVKISKIYPTTPNDKDFKVISGDSPFTLNPGGTHEIVLRFTPSESGRTTGRIAMEYDNTGSPIYVLLFGEGYILCGASSFEYPNFKNTNKLTMVDKAFQKDSLIRLTESYMQNRGALWYSERVNIALGFESSFKFSMSQGNIGSSDDLCYPGADGLAFVIQNYKPNPIGYIGGGMGYESIPNSLAVEFDTFGNDSTQIENYNDPNCNHAAIQSLGTEPNTPTHSLKSTLAINKDIIPLKPDNRIFYSIVRYDETNKNLKVYLDTLESCSKLILDATVDLSVLLKLNNNENAYVGFTAATGSASENHDILSWTFCSSEAQSINDIFEKNTSDYGIFLIPSPVKDILTIQFKSEADSGIIIRIYDIIGNVIDEIVTDYNNSGIQRINYSVSNIKNGFYICRMQMGKEIFYRSFIVNK